MHDADITGSRFWICMHGGVICWAFSVTPDAVLVGHGLPKQSQLRSVLFHSNPDIYYASCLFRIGSGATGCSRR
ncbi:hypothetical protein [Metapseudomonas furukawaii]|jgi:hypothetical protein|uniref:hypothetical protein n=1 Tax=Metapseudomonas furukawaii TaxID=1149133 RepID=UPI00103E21BE|nr:hypothetical protein [Pseudomonas furukawaii]WAG81864.1 hypothetical protein LMK08_26635 [Pseudomonas furukawaii]